MTPEEVAGDLVTIRIVGLPLSVWAAAEEHADGLVREFALIASEARGGDTHLPRQLLDLVDELEADYAALTSDQRAQLVDAIERGDDAIDLEYRVPRNITDACVRLEQALDAADRYCAEGEYLLSLATPPAALALRQWYLGEFVRQVGGQAPCSWSDWLSTNEVAVRPLT